MSGEINHEVPRIRAAMVCRDDSRSSQAAAKAAGVAAIFAKRINASIEVTNQAAEVHLSADPTFSEMLAEMQKNVGAKGSRVSGSKREPVVVSPTLADLWLGKNPTHHIGN